MVGSSDITYKSTVAPLMREEIHRWFDLFAPSAEEGAAERTFEANAAPSVVSEWVSLLDHLVRDRLAPTGPYRVRWLAHDYGAVPLALTTAESTAHVEMVSPDSRLSGCAERAWRRAGLPDADRLTFRVDGGYGPVRHSGVDLPTLVVLHHSHPGASLVATDPLARRWLSYLPAGGVLVISSPRHARDPEQASLESLDLADAEHEELDFDGCIDWRGRPAEGRRAERRYVFTLWSRRVPAPSSPVSSPRLTVQEERPLAGLSAVLIGSNLGGLSAAIALSEAGARTTLIEKGRGVGGSCQTFELGGCRFDLGEHLLPVHRPEASRFWHSLLSTDDFLPVYYHHGQFALGSVAPVPRSLRDLGRFRGRSAVNAYWESRIRADEDAATVPEHMPTLARLIKAHGNWFVENFVSYYMRRRSQADWDGISDKEVGAWLQPFKDAVPDEVGRILADPALSDSSETLERNAKSHNIHAEGVASASKFAWLRNALATRDHGGPFDDIRPFYPRLGCGALPTRMRDRLEELGGEVLLQQKIAGATTEGSRISHIRLDDGSVISADFVIASDAKNAAQMFDATPSPGGGPAYFVIYVALVLNRADVFPYTTISVTDPASRVLRITNFKNWSPDMVSRPDLTGLGVELRHSSWSDLDVFSDEPDETVLELVLAELSTMGICRPDDLVASRVFRVPGKRPIHLPRTATSLANLTVLRATNLAGTTAAGLTAADSIISSVTAKAPPKASTLR